MDDAPETGAEYDVVVVGGGPAGCSTGVFTARYGLDTMIFDRGNSSLARCAYLENYLGFPAGIDIETMYDLMHDHAETAGCTLVADMVEAVEPAPADEPGRFRVEPQDGDAVTAERVVAATKYDADYLRPLDAEEMFAEVEYDGEVAEEFDRDYPNPDGTTPVEGLYVASPADADAQAVMAAGHGARVARTLLADARRDRGYPDAIADRWDWTRREAELQGEWADPERWHEFLTSQAPDDHGLSAERFTELRERDIERRFDAYLSAETVEERRQAGHRRLLEHLDDDAILDAARDIEAERAEADDD